MDEHYDCLGSCHEDWVRALPADIAGLSVDEYARFPWKGPYSSCLCFASTTTSPSSLRDTSGRSGSRSFFTHKAGDRPVPEVKEFDLVDSLGVFHLACSGGHPNRSIINIDLDYFVESGFGDPFRIVSAELLGRLGATLKKGLENGSIACLTVALSPEFCTSWEIAEELASQLLRPLELGFQLPNQDE